MGSTSRLAGELLCCLVAVSAVAGADDWFVDVAPVTDLDFVHWDGRSGRKFYVETTASGGGWLDYDGDGDVDLYLLDGAATPGSPPPAQPPRNALFENQNGRWVDVTARAGVGDAGYGLGMCVGDVDGDGWLDLLVTNHGPDRLYESRGDGRFAEVAAAAGVADSRWSGSCAFGDLDGDDDLDLYVARYVDASFERHPVCADRIDGRRHYCRPEDFRGVTDSLYINRGDGSFREEGAARGIAQGPSERGLGVLLGDLDLDGDLDIYVTNDGTANRLYRNSGRGSFTDVALVGGSALNAAGLPEASMGVASGDFDGDGLPDLLLTHFSMETNTLYRALGGMDFDDATAVSGLGRPSYRQVGWGAELFDFDLDGDLDLAIANGHMDDEIETLEPSLRYRQPNQLFANEAGRFVEVTADAGSGWSGERVSRAMAVADWNNDGRPDLLVTNTNDRPQLLENRLSTSHRWLGVVLRDRAGGQASIGATARVALGSRSRLAQVRSGGAFQSQSDLRLLFGLGDAVGTAEIDVRWPDGRRRLWRIDRLSHYLVLPHPGAPAGAP